MKILLILFLCVNYVHSQGGEGDGSEIDGGEYVTPDQFISMLVTGKFKCPGCTVEAGYMGYQQAEFAARLNDQWIRHMEHKLLLWGYKLTPPPPIIINWFDWSQVAERKGGKAESAKVEQTMALNGELFQAAPAPESGLVIPEKIGQIFAVSVHDTIKKMNQAHFSPDIRGADPKKYSRFEEIPKIEKLQDMIAARKKTEEESETDVFFIFFHNEADNENRHIPDYLEIFDKYSNMADFYRTDTGFALFWAEQLDIYRVFDTIVAVHPQSSWIPRPDNPTIKERFTYLPIEYQYYDIFVHLQHGHFMNFARLHLGFNEEESEDSKQFPHVYWNDPDHPKEHK